jgi:hypothetical protein
VRSRPTASTRLAKLRGNEVDATSLTRIRPSPEFLLCPLGEKHLKLLLRVDALMYQQSVHCIDGGLEAFVS